MNAFTRALRTGASFLRLRPLRGLCASANCGDQGHSMHKLTAAVRRGRAGMPGRGGRAPQLLRKAEAWERAKHAANELALVRVILVQPFLDRNVGAVARCMLNFGLTDLVLVDPRCNHLSEDAISIAAGAERLLREARIFSQVPDGIGDADCVIAVTARQRSIAAAPAIYPRDLARVLATLSHPADLREEVTVDGGMVPGEQRRRGLAVMFGSERSGLTSEQLDSVNFLLLIPALPGFGSLNLSHAVAVVAYELWLAKGLTPTLPHLPHLLPDEQKGVDKKTEDRTRERADSAPRRALICWVERLGRALRERGYREEVNDSQRQRVQEVL